MFNTSEVIQARQLAKANNKTFDAVLQSQTGLSGTEILNALGATFFYPVLSVGSYSSIEADFERLPLSECQRVMALVVQKGGDLGMLFCDPTDETLQKWADSVGILIDQRFLVLESELVGAFKHFEMGKTALSGVMGEEFSTLDRQTGVEEISLARIDETHSPVIKLINSTLFDALGAGASDIHLEASAGGLVVKYRIDGVIIEAARVPGAELNEQAISRVKVMAELDITERRTPQDGRFKARIRDRNIDFRVSIMPSVFGEDAVIRILDKEHLSDQLSGLTLDFLGFDAQPMAVIRSLAAKPHGMLLLTGPTGSGKTTTLYAAISEINDGKSKIITIEDPVEYQVPGVLQIPVNERQYAWLHKPLNGQLYWGLCH